MKAKYYGVGIYVDGNLESVIQILEQSNIYNNFSFFLQCQDEKTDELYTELKKRCKYDVYKSVKKLESTPKSIWINCVSDDLFGFISTTFKQNAVALLLEYNDIKRIKELINLSISGGLIVVSKELFDIKKMSATDQDNLLALANLIVKPNSIPDMFFNISEKDAFTIPKKPKSEQLSHIHNENNKDFASIIINNKLVIEETSTQIDQYFKYPTKLSGKHINKLTPLFSERIWESMLNIVELTREKKDSIKKDFQDIGNSIQINICKLNSRSKQDTRTLITFSDNSEYYILMQDMERSEAKFKLFFENAPVGKSMMTPDGKYIKVNRTFAHMLGYKRHEMVNLSYTEITHPDDLDHSNKSLSILLEGHTKEFRFQKRYIGKDGQIIWTDVATRLFYSSEGKPMFFLTHIHDISKRIEAEKSLELNHAKTLTMFDAINELLYVSDPETYEIVYTNESFNKILGVKTTPVGKKCYAVIQGKSEPCEFCTNSKLFNQKSQEGYVWEFQNLKTNTWFRCADRVIDWIDGRKLRMELAIDITKEVEYRKNLERSQERYSLATTASNNGIWDWWTDSQNVYYSDQWKAQVGYSPEELENNFGTWERLLHPDDKERMVNRVYEFLENPDKYFIEEFRMMHKDGTPRWIHNRAAAVINDEGKVLRMFGSHTDITELKKAEEELRKTDLMYRGIIENAPDGVVMINMANRFSFVSNSALRMFGYSIDDIKDLDPSELTHPDDLDKVLELLQDLTSNKLKLQPTLEYRFKHSNGEWRWIESTFSLSLDENGNDAIVINFRDIRERKMYEQKLLEAKKKAEDANIHKNYFLANMSHEIRTPMNGVIGFSELLKDDDITSDQRKKYLEVIDTNAKQLLSLIDDIIDVAKIESNELKVHMDNCDIVDMMNDALSTFSEIKKQKGKDSINLNLHIPQQLSSFTINTDCHRLMQVFYNIIGNALKFSDSGNIDFGFSVGNNRIDFFVKDEGIGIPQDKLDEIFDRFKQLNYEDVVKYGGTGLGLSICRGIIELLGGEISVESKVGSGTHFKFYLPYFHSDLELNRQPESKFTSFDKAVDGIKILLVEDDPIVGMYFEEIFKPTNAILLWATNGVGALEIYKEHNDIDLVLMDIRMPEMNGYRATKEILKLNPKAKVIIQTAYAMQEERQKCFEAGCVDYLTKPIIKDELERKMPTWLVGDN